MFGRIRLITNGRRVFHIVLQEQFSNYIQLPDQSSFKKWFKKKKKSIINQFFDYCLQLSVEVEIQETLKENNSCNLCNLAKTVSTENLMKYMLLTFPDNSTPSTKSIACFFPAIH